VHCEYPIAVAVAPRRSFAVALVAPGADQTFDIGFHQQLQHRLRYAPQKIAVTGLLQQFRQRARTGLKSRNSTSTGRC
jgi:hypothetical protein